MNTIPKRRLDALIPLAIDVINQLEFEVAGAVSKTYHGYFSSFGADMVMTSPLAAVIFAEDKEDKDRNSKDDRSKISKAIYLLMQIEKVVPPPSKPDTPFSKYLIETFNGNIPSKTVEDMLAAAIALKIALRTFKKSK